MTSNNPKTLTKAKERHNELREKIAVTELALQENLKDTAKMKEGIEAELAEYRTEADEIISKLKKETDVQGIEFERSEDKMYRFGLNSCYQGQDHFFELTCETNNSSKTIYIMPKSSQVDISVDAIEIAEDLDNNIRWANSLQRNGVTNNIDVKFERPAGEFIQKQIDCGLVEYGAIKDTGLSDSVVEIFLHGSSIDGVLSINRVESLSNNKLSYDWTCSYSSSFTNPIPYVLSYESLKNDFTVSYNLSCLPRKIRKYIPNNRMYWKHEDPSICNGTKRTLINDMSEGRLYMPLTDIPNATYTVLKEWIPREEEQYHLYVNGSLNMKLKTGTNFTEFTVPRVEFLMKKSKVDVSIDACKVGILTLSDEGPRFANAIDWGNCIVYENTPTHKVLRFMGAKMKDVFQLKLEGNTWKANVTEVNRKSGHDLSNEQIDSIIELTKAKKERSLIAETVGCSGRTVYQYQKVLGYV